MYLWVLTHTHFKSFHIASCVTRHPHGFRSPSGPEATQQEAGHTAQDTGSGDAVLRGHLAMAQKTWSGAHKIHLIHGVDTG